MDEQQYFLLNMAEAFEKNPMFGLEYSERGLSLAPGAQRGVFLSGVMDGGEGLNTWKRARADCDIPEGASLCFEFYICDSASGMERMDRLLQGTEYSLQERLAQLADFKGLTVLDGGDFPLSGLSGRYLAFSCEMLAQGERRPTLRYVQIWRREDPLTRYLPEIYHEPDGFLDRFLQIFANQYRDAERAVDWVGGSLDPRTAPPESLLRLAGFMYIDHVRLWETGALRTLLSEGLYRRKGTLSGLRRLITIFTGAVPIIAECFRHKTGIEENDAVFSGAALLIILPESAGGHSVESLRLIVSSYLPSGVSYTIITAGDSVVLSGHTFLGVNSRISGFLTAGLGCPGGLGRVTLG